MTTHDLLVEMNTRLVKMQQEQPLLDPLYVNGYWRAVADLRALTERPRYQQTCEVCQKPMVGRRTGRMYCSAACKLRAFRRRWSVATVKP